MKKYKLICGYPQNDNITEGVAKLAATNAELLHSLETIMEDTESLYIREIAGEAIHKAKSHADTLKGE